MGISIKYNTTVSIPGLNSISMNNNVECDGYKIINLFLFKDENREVSSPIDLKKVQLCIFKTKDNKYSTITGNEGTENNDPPVERHIKYKFNNTDEWSLLKEPIFISNEKTMKAIFGDAEINTIFFKNETGEDRQIELYLVNTLSNQAGEGN
ncbi:MAG: hypothetical protein R2685_15700 [Candidatus Nitrosocosmicus sp.]|nr:hypothetical protein [Candidatus Nitrosocosmicus sp.]